MRLNLFFTKEVNEIDKITERFINVILLIKHKKLWYS